MRVDLNVLSLCSGIGCLDLGVRLAVPAARTVCYVEREAFSVANLVAQMEAGGMDNAPVFPDLCAFDARPWAGAVDCVVAGFPCQPVSLSGSRLAQDDPRWLWPHVQRILNDSGAPWGFFENVPGLRTKGLDTVLEGLASIGFDAEWCHFSAQAVGAHHRRNRWWLLAFHPGRLKLRQQPGWSAGAHGKDPLQLGVDGTAGDASHPDRVREPQSQGSQQNKRRRVGDDRRTVGNANGARPQKRQGKPRDVGAQLPTAKRAGGQPPVTRVGGLVDGPAAWLDNEPTERTTASFPGRVDALRALGNGVVPQQAAEAFRILMARYQ